MSDDDKSSLRLLLENNLNDIRYTKRQQWHLLYLTIIAISGITSLAFSIKLPPCHWFKIYLLLECIGIGIAGCFFIIRYAIDLENYRKYKRNLMKRLIMLNPSDKKSAGDSSRKGRLQTIIFTVIFCLIILSSLIPIFLAYQ